MIVTEHKIVDGTYHVTVVDPETDRDHTYVIPVEWETRSRFIIHATDDVPRVAIDYVERLCWQERKTGVAAPVREH